MIGIHSALKAILVFCLFVSTITCTAAMEPIPASAYVQSQERLLIVPGLHINLYCLGKGEPTVLLDSGLGDGTLSWRLVQGEIAKTTRACSFDRANYFFSDSVDRPATAQAMVDDMLALITKAELGVAQSYIPLGRHPIRLQRSLDFTKRYRDGRTRLSIPVGVCGICFGLWSRDSPARSFQPDSR